MTVMKVTNRVETANRRRTANGLTAFGVIFLLGGILLCVVPFTFGTVSQWNGRCHSEIGQITQHIVPGTTSACSLAALGDESIGWLIGAGAGLILIAIYLRATSRR
jgi:hypothetical protein